MHRFNLSHTFQLLIFAMFIALIGISPSLKVIPESLTPMSLHDSQRITELLFISMLLFENISFQKHNAYLSMNKPLCYAIFTLAVLAIISSFMAISPRHALIEISLLAGLFYLALYVARLYCEHGMLFIKRLTYVVWAGIMFSMAAFYVGYITATIFTTPVIWPGPITGFNNVRFFNQYQLWTLGLIVLPLLAFDLKNLHKRYLLHLGLICWYVLMFHTASRGALLAWALGLSITALMYKKLAWPLIRLQLIYITGGFLSFKILFELIPFLKKFAVVTGTIIRDTTSDRLALWSETAKLIQEHPVWGVGPMHFAWYSPISAHPHNSVLQIMAEWGLPAALLMLAIIFYSLYCWLKKLNIATFQSQTEADRNLTIVLFFTIVTNTAYSLVDGVIVMPISQIMMFTCIGLMMGHYNRIRVLEKNTNRLLPGRIIAGLVLLTLICSTLPEILQNASGDEKRFSIGYHAMGPRMWIEFR